MTQVCRQEHAGSRTILTASSGAAALAAAALTLGCDGASSVPSPGPSIDIPPAESVLPNGFTTIGSIRELADGRLLVADEQDNRLFVADFSSGSVRPLGTEGDGPGEYRQVGPLMPLAGDSTLMLDLRARRWLLLAGDSIATTIAASEAAVEATSSGQVLGTDAQGKVVAALYPANSWGGGGRADSLTVVRVDRHTARVDTVARASSLMQNGTALVGTPAGSAAGGPARYVMSAAQADQIVALPDGSVAVVRENPYRVDRCEPDGGCRAGPPLQDPPGPLTNEDKAEYLRTAAANASWPPTTDVAQTTNWPERMPPFTTFARRTYPTAVRAVEDGRILVLRTPTREAPAMRFDVIDLDNLISLQLILPVNAQIVGASSEFLYVVTTDEFDLQRLSRHPWP